MSRRVQLECIAFRRAPELEFLLMHRIPEKGGFWQPPCGGLEDDDASLLEGAYRELEEETGLTRKDVLEVLENVHTFVIEEHYLTGEPIDPITEHVFGFEVRPDVVVTIEENIYPEHDEVRWVDLTEALDLLKWENNKEAFKRLVRLIGT